MNTQESQMGYIRDLVTSLAEALVAATELPKQIEAVKAELATLSQDLERTKQRNIELDTMLNDTRRQRDEAEAEARRVKAELSQAQTEAHNLQRDAENANARAANLQNELEQTKRERDEYGLKQMEAEDRANSAEAKLKKLREAMGIEEPKPMATPQHDTQAKADPVDRPEQAQPEPAKRIYDGEPSFYWSSSSKWDDDQHKYYNEI